MTERPSQATFDQEAYDKGVEAAFALNDARDRAQAIHGDYMGDLSSRQARVAEGHSLEPTGDAEGQAAIGQVMADYEKHTAEADSLIGRGAPGDPARNSGEHSRPVEIQPH